jgi:hypothetical protein
MLKICPQSPFQLQFPTLWHKNGWTDGWTGGFTLIEMIVSIGFLSILLFGVIAGIHPILSGSEKLTAMIATDMEIAFVERKISWMLSSAESVFTPRENDEHNTLTVYHTSETLVLENDEEKEVLLLQGLPITTERTLVRNFAVKHRAPQKNTPRAIEITFDANGTAVGPLLYYVYP